MIVTYEDDKYYVVALNSETEVMRQAPIRRWNRGICQWVMPAIPQIRDYLHNHGAKFVGGAENAPEKRLSVAAGLQFQVKTAPRDYQNEALKRSTMHASFALFMDPGLGKTKVMIDDATYLRQHNLIHGMVVLCPNSVSGNWVDEFNVHSLVEPSIHIWKAGGVKALSKWTSCHHNFPVLIVAIESLSTKTAFNAVMEVLKTRRWGVYLDESSYIKTFDAARTKHIIAIGGAAAARRIASGTPATKGAHNLWSQFQFLNPDIIDMAYYPYRAQFCVMGGFERKQVVGDKNFDMLAEMIAPYVIKVRKTDCLDLPAKIYQTRRVTLTEWQEAEYARINAESEHPLVRDLRLHQLLGGFVVRAEALQNLKDLIEKDPEAALAALEDEGDTTYVTEPCPGGNPRLTELQHVLEEIPGKVVIWCRYRAEVEAIANALGEGVVQFHGGVSRDPRDKARRDFQTDPEVRYFVGQIATGGIGITLTAASTMVYYSSDWSAERRIQSEDRIHRVGQVAEACVYIDLLTDGHRVDAKIRDAVKAGKDYHEFVLDSMRGLPKLDP